jgi:hypothetical protein
MSTITIPVEILFVFAGYPLSHYLCVHGPQTFRQTPAKSNDLPYRDSVTLEIMARDIVISPSVTVHLWFVFLWSQARLFTLQLSLRRNLHKRLAKSDGRLILKEMWGGALAQFNFSCLRIFLASATHSWSIHEPGHLDQSFPWLELLHLQSRNLWSTTYICLCQKLGIDPSDTVHP